MSKKNPEKIINYDNLYIFISAIFQILTIVFPIFCAVILTYVSLYVGFSNVSESDSESMQRAGSAVIVIGIIYTFFEEFISPRPEDMEKEIMSSVTVMLSINKKESQKPIKKFSEIAKITISIRRFIVRSTEIILLCGGTLLNGFGDMLGGMFF